MNITIMEFKNKFLPSGKEVTLPWQEFLKHLQVFDVRVEKTGRCFSPTIYKPGTSRANANVVSMTALVGDFEHTVHWDVVFPLLERWEYVMHTTFSHTLADPHYRIILPFVVPVDAQAWVEWVKASVDRQIFKDLNDKVAKDPSRFYYYATARPEAQYYAAHHVGEFLDVTKIGE